MARHRNKNQKRSINNPAVPLSQAFHYLAGPIASSGITVNRETVLGYPAVWRGVNLISQKLARLPLLVYKHQKNGGRIVDDEHPAYWLLAKVPSTEYTPFTFKQTLTAHALLHGNGYAYIQRDEIARPIELLVLDPQNTYAYRKNGNLGYITQINGQPRKLLAQNVLHIKGLSADGLTGYSVIWLLRDAFGLSLAVRKYGSVFFRNNGAPNTIIELPGFFKDQDAIKRFRESWGNIHQGLDNAHRVAILENGAKLSKFTINNDEAQFLQTAEFEVKSIANIFGVPPHKLGANISTSYGSLEAENKAFLNDSLEGWLCTWEEQCEAKLLQESQKVRDSHFVSFDRSELEQADQATETDVMVKKVTSGLWTLNDALARMNMPGIGELGDKRLVPANLVFLDDLEKEEPQPVPQPVPQVPPEADPQGKGQQDPPEADQGDGKDQGDGTAERFARLVRLDLERQLTRLEKALTAASKREGWQPAEVLAEHRAVFVDSLAPASAQAEAIVDQYLDSLAEELAAVTRDQLGVVLARQDVQALTERFTNGKTV